MPYPLAVALAQIGLDTDAISGVVGEVSLVLGRGVPGTLTFDDVRAEAFFHVLRAKRRKPEAGGGYFRMVTRYALRSLVYREARALKSDMLPLVPNNTTWPIAASPASLTTAHRNRSKVMKRCIGCGTKMAVVPAQLRCKACAKARRQRLQRVYRNRWYDVHRRAGGSVRDAGKVPE